jgi:uroporphyrinogen-III synthase
MLLQLAGEAAILGPLLAMPHACLSDDVAEPLRAAGAARVVVAERPNEEALLATLVMLAPAVAARLPGRGDAKDGTNLGF